MEVITSHAVYAGSFDPITKGHVHIISQAAPLFEKLTIAIGVNPTKKSYFKLTDRLSMLEDVATTIDASVATDYFEGQYLVDYAESIGAQYIVRGLRNSADFEAELTMAQINQKLNPRIRTVFFMADRAFADISSSSVKGLIGYRNWQKAVRKYLPVEIHANFFKAVDSNQNLG